MNKSNIFQCHSHYFLKFCQLPSTFQTETQSSHLKGSQHATRNQYQEPEVHMEELGDFISHKHRKNQQKETHAEASEVFPHTPKSRSLCLVNYK